MLNNNSVKKDLNSDKSEKEENTLWEWIKSIAIALVLALLIKNFIFEPTKISGNSMNKTLLNNDQVIVNKIVMKFRPLERGDIVVMKYDEERDYIKRIIGLPGENIQIIEGKVYINGKEHKESYIYGDYTLTDSKFEWRLQEDEYFLMGDNRTPGGSTDSRVFGPVHLDKIKGVASFRFYPFGEGFGLLK